MNFSDQFIQPNFAADIKDLDGTLTGLSTDPNSSAKVDLKGEVGEFSPVTIAGEIQLFAFDRHTDIGMKFENIPLPIFNPYSGRFAGYNIAKGSLTTDLQYLIEDRKLEAKHHIRIDQLEWGEATASKEAVPLPVKLATSLLKDVDGVIDLNVPVNGTLDDPKFRIGPIVWQIIKNILVKAVTAPFRLLGSLFKGAEEAQFVQFAPGEATLDPAAAEQMSALAKGLAQKPEIKLDVPIGVVEELDRPALVDQAVAAEISAATREIKRIKPDDETPPPSLETLEPKEQIAVLTTVVEKLTGAAPQIAPPPQPPEGTSRKEARAMEQAATLEALEEQARAAVQVDPLALAAPGSGARRSDPIRRCSRVASCSRIASFSHATTRSRPRTARCDSSSGSSSRRIAPAHQAFLRDARDQLHRRDRRSARLRNRANRKRSGSRARRAASRRCGPGGGTTSRGRCSRW